MKVVKHNRRPVVVSGLLPLVFFFAGCAREADPDATLKGRLAELQALTLPPGSRITISSDVIRNQFSVVVNWEFETQWDWQKYSAWLRAQLVGFEVIRVNDSEIVFSRRVDADVQTITVNRLLASRMLRVQVIFSMYPQ